jgi:large subunit ribosomal protein L10
MANKEAKAPVIDELADKLSRSSIAIVTDYRGLRVSDITDLRRRLRAANVDYQVAKNTLTRFAAERVGKSAMNVDLEGPTAIAFAYDEPAAAARVMRDYLRTSRVLQVKGAMLGERRLSADELQSLADLPGKPDLQARLVGTIQSPMASLVGTISGLLTQIAYVVDQRAQQLGGGAVEIDEVAAQPSEAEAAAPESGASGAATEAVAQAEETPAETVEATAQNDEASA